MHCEFVKGLLSLSEVIRNTPQGLNECKETAILSVNRPTGGWGHDNRFWDEGGRGGRGLFMKYYRTLFVYAVRTFSKSSDISEIERFVYNLMEISEDSIPSSLCYAPSVC